MCVTSLCTRGALDTWSRGRSTAALDDMRLAWNTATSFGLGGYLLAGFIAWAYLGWYWVYLPGALAALMAGYIVSTSLGALAARNTKLLGCIVAGMGVAVATLTAGVLALGVANVFLVWLDDVTAAGWGYGPFYSVGKTLEDFVLKPLLTVLIFGGWIALILGLVYGVALYSRTSKRSGVLAA
jgi:hypothetical protein